jgi:6-phosphofructokinase 1
VIERLRAAEFIKTALDNIQKNPNKIVTYYDDRFILRDLKEIVNSKYELNKEMLSLAKKMMGV